MTAPTRVTLKIGSRVFAQWTQLSIVRDLHEISGAFELRLLDPGRLPNASVPPIQCGQVCTLALDGEAVLIGRVEETDIAEAGAALEMCVRGRDHTGNLVDCAAAPNGPAEYKGLTLTQIAAAICRPFGIKVAADVDVGAPFARFSIQPHQTALAAIESAAR